MIVRALQQDHVRRERGRHEHHQGADGQHLRDAVGAAEQAGDAGQQPGEGEQEPGQVQHRDRRPDRGRLLPEVRAEQDQHVLHGQLDLLPPQGDRDGLTHLQGVHLVAARRTDTVHRQPGQAHGNDGGRRQPRVVPAGPPAPHQWQGRPDQADQRYRHRRGVRSQRVVDLRPDQQQHRPRDRPPAFPRAVDEQQRQQDRHADAGVIGGQQQDVRARDVAGRHQDASGEDRPDDALGAARGPPGEQRGAEHEQRVDDRGGDVRDIGAEAVDHRDQAVYRDLERGERHVGDEPAVQQDVAVHHVPALQHHPGGVGVHRRGPRLEQVAPEQRHRRGDERARPEEPRPGGRQPPRVWRPRRLLAIRGRDLRCVGRGRRHLSRLSVQHVLKGSASP